MSVAKAFLRRAAARSREQTVAIILNLRAKGALGKIARRTLEEGTQRVRDMISFYRDPILHAVKREIKKRAQNTVGKGLADAFDNAITELPTQTIKNEILQTWMDYGKHAGLRLRNKAVKDYGFDAANKAVHTLGDKVRVVNRTFKIAYDTFPGFAQKRMAKSGTFVWENMPTATQQRHFFAGEAATVRDALIEQARRQYNLASTRLIDVPVTSKPTMLGRLVRQRSKFMGSPPVGGLPKGLDETGIAYSWLVKRKPREGSKKLRSVATDMVWYADRFATSRNIAGSPRQILKGEMDDYLARKLSDTPVLGPGSSIFGRHAKPFSLETKLEPIADRIAIVAGRVGARKIKSYTPVIADVLKRHAYKVLDPVDAYIESITIDDRARRYLLNKLNKKYLPKMKKTREAYKQSVMRYLRNRV